MNNTSNLEKNNVIKSIIKGYLCSTILTCIFLFIYAAILVNTNIKENTITPIIITITAISLLIGSSFGCLKVKKNGAINGLCIGLVYFFTLYILSGFSSVGFTIGIKTIIMIICGTILGGIGGIIGVNIRK